LHRRFVSAKVGPVNRHETPRFIRCGSRPLIHRMNESSGFRTAALWTIGLTSLPLLSGPISAAELECPDGSEIRGVGPPDGHKRWCENPEGEQHGPSVAWYPDAGKAIEAYFVHGRLEGSYRSWYPNGQLAEETQYVDDLRDGTYRRWLDDGSLHREQTFRAGVPSGRSVEWYTSGQVKFDESFVDGKKQGPAVGYYENLDLVATRWQHREDRRVRRRRETLRNDP
jgi:hypothetical protein